MHFRKMRICYRNVNRSLAIRAGPKFHIVAPDFQVLVRISDLMVIADEARPTQIAEVIAWAHRESLALKWAELNERG